MGQLGNHKLYQVSNGLNACAIDDKNLAFKVCVAIGKHLDFYRTLEGIMHCRLFGERELQARGIMVKVVQM